MSNRVQYSDAIENSAVNPIQKLWQQDAPVINGWLSLGHSFSAEIMARAGWDAVTVDMQHGLSAYAELVPLIQAINLGGAAPMVRVPWLEAGIIMRTLDAGALGVICPMINSVEDCERFIAYCLYPPQGQRSFGPIRARVVYGDDYPNQANTQVLPIAMIETREALAALDDILQVPGLAGIYIGPADLANSLGCEPCFDPTSKEILGTIRQILQQAQKYGIPAGIHNGGCAFAKKMINWGFRLVTVGSDARFIAAQAQQTVQQMKSQSAQQQVPVSSGY